MPNLTLALEDLRVDLAETQRQISILEQITRELTLIVDRCDGAGADPLIRRHLVEIDRRNAAALARHTPIARMLEESGRELPGRASGAARA